MPKAVVVRETGGTDVLKLENIPPPPKPKQDHVLIRHTAIGINYIDIYYRNGLYKAPSMPFIPGIEACGVIEDVADNIKDLKKGTKVAYATVQSGAYCEYRLIHRRHLVAVPDGLNDRIAAACLVKGLTAHFLLFRTFRVRAVDTILVHAAAGGVGQLICQWAKIIGARVIGTVSSAEKAQIAKANGCDYPIIYTKEDFVGAVAKITRNAGVSVVYDSVGKDTFFKSMECLHPLGCLVSFGQSSGPVPPINILSLAPKGIFITRPTLALYKSNPAELMLSASEVFQRVLNGHLKVNIYKTYRLEEAALAQAELENRKTTGSIILLPK